MSFDYRVCSFHEMASMYMMTKMQQSLLKIKFNNINRPGSLTNCRLITERARFTRWRVYDDWRRQGHCGGDQIFQIVK